MSDSPQVHMIRRRSKIDRRTEILQSLAALLEEPSAEKITTARLAAELGVSEGALYRHFKGKAEMYDALIDFAQESLLSLFAQIRDRADLSGRDKARAMVQVMLDFADANRGLVRLLTGHALVNESPALSDRVRTLNASLEQGLKQSFREAVLAGEIQADFNASARAAALMSYVNGQWLRYVLSNFHDRPNRAGPVTLAFLFV